MNSNNIYKLIQKGNTEKEKKRLLSSGMVFLSLENYKKMLLDNFNLKLNTKDALKYYNNLNQNIGEWLECSADAIDETNHSYANIYGKFYQEEIKKQTKKYNDFREFRNTYFTQLKTGHLICL